MKRKKVIISGVNMVDSGILSIYLEMIKAFSKKKNINVICLVNNKGLFKNVCGNNIKLLEFKDIKKSWFKRLYFEFITSYFINKKSKSDLWICLHDITANIGKGKQYVYCHNPSPFYKASSTDFELDKKFYLFTKFYKYLYQINIKKNKAVIVQQSWIANSFKEWFGIDNVIVSKPEGERNGIQEMHERKKVDGPFKLIYPAYPRVFKNIELLIDALFYLKNNLQSYYDKIEITLTFNHGTSLYGDAMLKKARALSIDNIKFVGFLDRDTIYQMYKSETDGLIFPSKLETWGLPISEAKMFGLPILAANFEYAKETVGEYKNAFFFDNNVDSIVNALVLFIDGNIEYPTKEKLKPNYQQFSTYDELISFMIDS